MNLKEIYELEVDLKKYIFQVVEIEELGEKVEFKKIKEFLVLEELEVKFNEMFVLKNVFEVLIFGWQ